MQVSAAMSDPRHKKSPPKARVEMNTPTFRKEAAEVLARNDRLNRLAGRRKGDPGYLVASHADVADKLGHKNQRLVDRILGGVREGTEVKLIEKSKYVSLIRDILELRRVEIAVPMDRADVLVQIANLPEKDFAPYRESIERRGRS